MAASKGLAYPLASRLYVGAVVVSGAAVSLFSLSNLALAPPEGGWYWLTLLTLVSGFLSVKFHAVGAR